MNGYFVKFKNYTQTDEGTGKLHIDILQKYGKVIWGQWTSGTNIMSENTFNRMKETNFFLYALDKSIALLKMHVIEVLRKEDVVNQSLDYLIPNYYSVDTPTSAFYLIDKIEVFPPVYSWYLLSSKSNLRTYNANNVNSNAPWRVYEEKDFNKLTINDVPEIKVEENNLKKKVSSSHKDTTNDSYSVYKYTCKITNTSYIGMTNSVERRRSEHENPNSWKNSKKYLYTFFAMFGLENFTFELLHTGLTEEEAHYWEAKEIENYNSYYPNGFNERSEKRYLTQFNTL